MGKPLLAVDLDDVVTLHEAELIRHYCDRYGVSVTLSDMRDLEAFERETGHPPELVVERMRTYMASAEAYAVRPMAGAVEALRRLREQYRLVLVTSRSRQLEAQLVAWVECEMPGIFESVHLTGEGPVWGYVFNSDKTAKLRELGADILIDDGLNHCCKVAEMGIRALLFGEYLWNEATQLPEGVERVRDWDEVLAKLI